jgi:DNA-binding NarL/FixJ family response regulator
MPKPETLDRRSLVLVADDEAVSRTLLRESLEQAGFEVIEAEDGLRALQSFTETAPELVVMGGVEACAALPFPQNPGCFAEITSAVSPHVQVDA